MNQIPAKNSSWRSHELPLTPIRETSARAALANTATTGNTNAVVSKNPAKLLPLPEHKYSLAIGRLLKILGSRVRVIDTRPKNEADRKAEKAPEPTLAEKLIAANRANLKTGAAFGRNLNDVKTEDKLTANQINNVSEDEVIVFVSEGILTDIEWNGNNDNSRVQIDGRWFHYRVSNLTRSFYTVEDIHQDKDSKQQRERAAINTDRNVTELDTSANTCSEWNCTHKTQSDSAKKRKAVNEQLRVKHPRTLAFADWK